MKDIARKYFIAAVTLRFVNSDAGSTSSSVEAAAIVRSTAFADIPHSRPIAALLMPEAISLITRCC